MYAVALTFHSWMRWLAILLGLWTVASALGSARGRPGSGRPSLLYTVALDIQLLAGVLLYVALSPVTRAAIADLPAAMHNSAWRFWSVEHPALMILAVVFGHLGRVASRGRGGAAPRPSRAPLVWYGLSLAAILAAVPWPFLSYGRPLFRW